jgi:hypothetical protein
MSFDLFKRVIRSCVRSPVFDKSRKIGFFLGKYVWQKISDREFPQFVE